MCTWVDTHKELKKADKEAFENWVNKFSKVKEESEEWRVAGSGDNINIEGTNNKTRTNNQYSKLVSNNINLLNTSFVEQVSDWPHQQPTTFQVPLIRKLRSFVKQLQAKTIEATA